MLQKAGSFKLEDIFEPLYHRSNNYDAQVSSPTGFTSQKDYSSSHASINKSMLIFFLAMFTALMSRYSKRCPIYEWKTTGYVVFSSFTLISINRYWLKKGFFLVVPILKNRVEKIEWKDHHLKQEKVEYLQLFHSRLTLNIFYHFLSFFIIYMIIFWLPAVSQKMMKNDRLKHVRNS